MLIQQAARDDRFYSIACFINASSTSAPTSFAALALQGIVRDLTNSPNLRLNFHEKPLPFGFKLQTYINAG